MFSGNNIKLLSLSLDALTEAWIIGDENGKLIQYNSKSTLLFPKITQENMGKPVANLLPEVENYLKSSIRTTEGFFSLIVQDKLEYFEVRSEVIRDKKGKVMGQYWILDNKTREFFLKEELKISVSKDPMTEIWNRRYWMCQAEKEWIRAVRYDRPMTLILAEVDHFSTFIETQGPEAGDQLLHSIALDLDHGLRSTDLLGRYGNEKFIILLPETPLHFGLPLAQRLHGTIGHKIQRIQENDFTISLSVGVAGTENDRSEDLNNLINRAELAMEKAQSLGFNQVIQALDLAPLV